MDYLQNGHIFLIMCKNCYNDGNKNIYTVGVNFLCWEIARLVEIMPDKWMSQVTSPVWLVKFNFYVPVWKLNLKKAKQAVVFYLINSQVYYVSHRYKAWRKYLGCEDNKSLGQTLPPGPIQMNQDRNNNNFIKVNTNF